MNSRDQKLKALEFFKDWSNYLLVTTIAALGWVSAKDASVHSSAVVWFFALSSVFGIFTLALIPIIANQIDDNVDSFYEVEAKFKLFWMWGDEWSLTIKKVCWPQHVFFLLGVLVYAYNYA